MKAVKYFLGTVMLLLLMFQNAMGIENENNFLEFYSKNKDFLDPNSPFANTLENFAEYHDALLSVIEKFEKSKSYEDAFPVEGKMTLLQRKSDIIQAFNFFLTEAVAKNKESICFFGGWPSRTLGGYCQSPWKNSDDKELMGLGSTYDSNHYCGGANLFRCNPLLFGPGEDSKGTCIEFKKVSEISSKCYDKSRDQVGKLYKAFNENPEYRKNYLATVSAMKNFCSSWKDYPACKVLLLKEKEITDSKCLQQFNIDQEKSASPINNLAKQVVQVTSKVVDKPLPTPAIPYARKPADEISPKIASQGKLQICTYFNDFIKQGVPELALKQALNYYAKNKSMFSNDKYISIADYSQNSANKRFFMLDLTTGNVTKEKVSHGSGAVDGIDYGDQNHDGNLDRCTQSDGSKKNMTRPGFYKVDDYYTSVGHLQSWPSLDYEQNNGMRLFGLSKTNGDALGKGVVMHEAYYNQDGNAVMGRSYGCPAFVPGRGAPLMKKIKGGSLFYAYAPVCSNEMNIVLKDPKVSDWQNTCTK